MERRRYLVAYDIANPRRLRAVHRIVVAHGDSLQYSVYLCDLTEVELVGLRGKLRDVIHHGEDAVSIFDLGLVSGSGVRRVQHLGRPATEPSDGPAIW